jgi:hypothetical protein
MATSPLADSRTFSSYIRNHGRCDEVVMPLVCALSAVLLGELDTITFHTVDSAEVCSVCANVFHTLSILTDIGHEALLQD